MIVTIESAVSFALLRPAGFDNFTGRGGARPAFCGAGRGGAACFTTGRGKYPWYRRQARIGGNGGRGLNQSWQCHDFERFCYILTSWGTGEQAQTLF